MVDWTLISPNSLTLPSSSSSPSSTTFFVFFFLHIKTSHLFDHCYQSWGEPGGDDAKRIHCQRQCQAPVLKTCQTWGTGGRWGGGEEETETQIEEHKSIELLLRS